MSTTTITCGKCGASNRVDLDKLDKKPVCGECRTALEIFDKPVAVTDDSFDADVRKSSIPVLVDFWAPWCGPCRAVAPVLEELAKDFAGRIKIAKVNTDDNPGEAQGLGIRGIPTLILFKDGKEVNRQVGAAPKQHLQSFIEGALK